MTFIYSYRFFWIASALFVVAIIICVLLTLICVYNFNAKNGQMDNPPINSAILGVVQDDRGIIQPDVVFYRKPSADMSFRSYDNSSIRGREASISISDCEMSESLENSNASFRSPLRPLSPAYQLNSEVLHISNTRLLPPLCQNITELALPPGFVSSMVTTNASKSQI